MLRVKVGITTALPPPMGSGNISVKRPSAFPDTHYFQLLALRISYEQMVCALAR